MLLLAAAAAVSAPVAVVETCEDLGRFDRAIPLNIRCCGEVLQISNDGGKTWAIPPDIGSFTCKPEMAQLRKEHKECLKKKSDAECSKDEASKLTGILKKKA